MILSFTRKCMQTLASIAAIWCSLTSVSWSDEISGVVKSLDNRPLSSVKILSGHAVALTDAKGHFRLKDNPVQVLHFRAPGFRPATKVLKPTDREVVVFLEEGRGSEWNIATCPETDRDKRLGNPLALPIPMDASVRRVRGVDTWSYFVYFRSREDNSHRLEILTGDLILGTTPPANWFTSARQFHERVWQCGSLEGVDVRGESSQGKRFRWFGYLTEAISYYDASEEAANYFDSLIDGICLPSARMPVKRLEKRRTQAGSY